MFVFLLSNFFINYFFKLLLTDEQGSSVPILILATKIDLPDAVREEKLRESLEIFSVITKKTDVFFYNDVLCRVLKIEKIYMIVQ